MSPQTLILASRYNHKRSIQINTWDDNQSPKSNFIFDVRWVEFIFSQTAPAVCLPCKQTDFITRIIALFKVLLYSLSSKKLLKSKNTRSNQYELEFTFSFDHNKIIYKNIFFTQKTNDYVDDYVSPKAM